MVGELRNLPFGCHNEFNYSYLIYIFRQRFSRSANFAGHPVPSWPDEPFAVSTNLGRQRSNALPPYFAADVPET
jgi:hypothetical protein